MASIIFGTTLDMLTVATPSSGAYVIAYDLDGILKQKDEFGVITEIGGGPTGGIGLTPSLSDVMNISNIATSLIMGTMTSILSSNGGGRIDLDYSGASNSILLSSDNGSQLQGRLYLTSTEGTFGFNNTFIKTTNNDISLRVDNIQHFLIRNNSTASVVSSGLDKYGSIISSKLSEIQPGVVNSVVIGGQGLTASSNDTVYVQNLNINNKFTLPNIDGSNGQSMVTDGFGNLSWAISSAGLADVLSTDNDSGVNSIIMGTSTSILSSNGGGQIDLDYGSTSSISLSTDNGSFLKSYLILDNDDIIIDANGTLNIGASAGSVIIDNLQGLVYGFDYSSTFVGNSLVSKTYVDTGTNSIWSEFNNYLLLSGGTLTGNLVINGDLMVSGTQTVINTENLYVEDNIITLNATYSGPAVIDAGVEVNLGDGTYSKVLWNAGIGYWQVGLSGSESTIITEAGSGLTKSNNQLEVDFGTVSSISYVDAGTASLWAAIDNINNDYITEVIGGQGLTGGGTAGTVTLDLQTTNGLDIISDSVGLGGTLSQNTTINGGGYDITLGDIGYLLFTSSIFDVETNFISLDSGTGSTQILSGSDVTVFGNNLDLLSTGGVYIVGSSFSVNSVEIDPTSATTGQALIYDGVKFSPSTLSGDISGITAGAGLTGGGSSGYVTLDAQVNNGLSITSDYIGLGGSLNKFTTITQGGNTMSFVGGNVTMGSSVAIGTSSTALGYVLNANGNVVIGETGVNTLLSFLGPNVDLTAASANYININTGYRIRFYTYSTLMAQFDTFQSIFYGNVSSSATMSVGGNLIVDTNLIYANSTLNKVGIGTSTPDSTLEVYFNGFLPNSDNVFHSSSVITGRSGGDAFNANRFDVSYTGTSSTNHYRNIFASAPSWTTVGPAFYSYAVYGDGYGISDRGVGIFGRSGNGTSRNIGIYGNLIGSAGSTENFAIYGYNQMTSGTGTQYAGKFYNTTSATANSGDQYGIHSLVSRSGAGTGTSNLTAGYFQATGGLNNYSIIVPSSGGYVGVGTTTPTEQLHVVGNFRYVDGNQSDGYVLVSDSNGVASWTSLPTSTIKVSDIRNFTASVAETITHTLNTEDLIIQTYDSTGLQIIPDSIQINGTASIDVTISQTLSNVKTIIIG